MVWVQGPPLPADHQHWYDSWLKYNPDWDQILWNEESYLPYIRTHDPLWEIYQTAVNHAQRSEIASKAILYHWGGVFHDADFECFRPCGHFFNSDQVVTWDESPGQLGNQLIGAPPYHPAVLEALEDIPRAIRHQRSENLPQTFGAGPHLIQRLWRDRDDVEIRPSKEFFPYLWNQPKPADFGDAYGAHHWTASWK